MKVGKKVILASNSPRRKLLLGGLDLDFEVRVIDDIDESYPEGLEPKSIAEYIAKKKADAYKQTMNADELIITADTIVVLGNKILGKPADEKEAKKMLGRLSGKTHQVITGVCMLTAESEKVFSVTTDVTFRKLFTLEITHYVKNFRPFDKAGAYGIQEWIGHVGVTSINGSYFNAMGLPVQRIYKELKNMNRGL